MEWKDLQSYNDTKEVVNSWRFINNSDENGVKLCFVVLDTSKRKATTKHSSSSGKLQKSSTKSDIHCHASKLMAFETRIVVH